MKELLQKIGKAGLLIDIVDGKLKLHSDGSQIDSEILNAIKTKKDEITAYLIQNDVGAIYKTQYENIPLISLDESYPISNAQRRLWVLSQFEDGSVAYNMPSSVYLNQDIDIDYFKRAIESTIERHEILRTVFKEDEGEIRQWILTREDLGFEIDYKDFRKEENKEEKVKNYIAEDSYKSFDLENGPLLRAGIIRVEDKAYVFYYNMHHIISDGWSMEVLAKDVFSYYDAYKENNQPALKELRIQYKDYSAWALAQLGEESFKTHRAYWLNSLEGELPLLDLPGTKQRPRIKTHNGHGLSAYIDSTTTGKLKKYSEANGGSLFMGLLAAWNVLMYRYTGQKDIIIGTPIAGREHADLEDQIGFYVNTLALRNEIKPEESFNAFYSALKDNTLKSYSHQMYPFDRLVEELDLQRDTSRSAVFDLMLVLQNNGEKAEGVELSKEELNRIVDLGHSTSKFDIDIAVQEIGDYLSLQVVYNPDVYEREMVEGLINHYRQLLNALLESPEEKISQIDYLSQAEKHELLVTFNDTKVDYPKDKTIVDLFEEQAAKTPDNIALVFEGTQLTYKKLNEKANQLANYLRNTYKVQGDDLIGIKLNRNEWMLIAILGVLKSGGAYVPIDLEYPDERIEYMLADSKCKVVIDINELKRFGEEKARYSNENLEKIIQSSNLAYIIYTSGSTGKPKGVMIEHKNIASFFESCRSKFNLRQAKL